ncbi:hypothetical protein NA57DRAFT_74472 [Rhizodiscina lignyota]|uniref:Riboflavin kinase n=1 Tax=Rhizodiscina lignyota TaxID=1504668 RepID=A0A9P4M7U8_9PEZI|nr:hypothetical protein NA57DRAFT_74472 [Rhizodiscina lignyota]
MAAVLRRKPVPGAQQTQEKKQEAPQRELRDLSLETTSDATPEPLLVSSPASIVASPTSTSTSTLWPGDEIVGVVPEDGANDRHSKFKTAFEDVRHFAGGLISHPYEATKHCSILRHSHGLVYYKGFNTNVAITVFGDRALPDDRQFWLQKRGFSGNTGLKIGASMFGVKSAWINVTPTVTGRPEDLPRNDERAWQRDIEKFLRKAPKAVRHHRPLETNILRIPCSADDGYFRILLCTGERGKKTLCPSPIFRLVSTSASMGSIRGASLSTLPLEMAMKIGQFAARQAASNAVAPLAGVAAQRVQSIIPWQPSGLTSVAASTAYGSVQDRMDSANEAYEEAQQRNIEEITAQFQQELDHATAIGKDSGPETPFPMQFSAQVVRGSGRSRTELGMPTANLSGISEDILLRLSGTYCGWVSFLPQKALELPTELLEDWHQAIITAAPITDAKASVVLRKEVRAYLIQDFQNQDFFDAKLSILVMGMLRPQTRVMLGEVKDIETRLSTMFRDIATVQASLSRPTWGADQIMRRIQTDKSNRSLSEKFGDAHRDLQRQTTDKVPFHWAGVRTDSMTLRDQLVGNGGVSVPR